MSTKFFNIRSSYNIVIPLLLPYLPSGLYSVNVFHRLSELFFQSFINRKHVREATITHVLEDPDALDIILYRACRNESAIRKLVRHRAVFESLLSRVTSNPEALLKVLSSKAVVTKLSAQKSFLYLLLNDENCLAQILSSKRICNTLILKIASKEELVLKILLNAASCCSSGSRPSERIKSLFKRVSTNPVFQISLQQDAELLESMVQVIMAAYESSGESIRIVSGDTRTHLEE